MYKMTEEEYSELINSARQYFTLTKLNNFEYYPSSYKATLRPIMLRVRIGSAANQHDSYLISDSADLDTDDYVIVAIKTVPNFTVKNSKAEMSLLITKKHTFVRKNFPNHPDYSNKVQPFDLLCIEKNINSNSVEFFTKFNNTINVFERVSIDDFLINSVDTAMHKFVLWNMDIFQKAFEKV